MRLKSLTRQLTEGCLSIRQHPSAYVSIRQHTPASVSIRQHTARGIPEGIVSIRQHTHTSAYVSILIPEGIVSIRQHTHTSASVSIRQHTDTRGNGLSVKQRTPLVLTRLELEQRTRLRNKRSVSVCTFVPVKPVNSVPSSARACGTSEASVFVLLYQ
jgi:hypothetical protein